MGDKDNINDLIGGSNQPIIIHESGDKKFLYTIIILLSTLFIAALAIVVYMSGKYFNTQKINRGYTGYANSAPVNSKQSSKHQVAVDELEKLANGEKGNSTRRVLAATTATDKKIEKVASNVAGGKKLSQEELAQIAKMVAQELKGSQKQTTDSKKSAKNADSALVEKLQSASTDTLANKNLDESNLKDSVVNKSAKKVDTFNKVVVKESKNGDDEVAKLSAEIDSILASSEVKNKEKNLKYGKELKEETANREKAMRFIVVKSGDTLSAIARRAYGKSSAYKKIYEANPDLIKNPDRIYIGMKLRVPVDEEYIKREGE